MKQVVLFTFIAAALVGCGPSTEIVKTWQEPTATLTRSPDNKALVIAMVKDETSRRVIEDQLVKRMNGSAVASYTVLSADMLKSASQEALAQTIKDGKYNYVLLMRLADMEKETYYVQGTTTAFYGGYGRYYGYGAGMYTNPGYYTTDKNYFVETTVYSVDPDKLLWTGTTKSVNPSKVEKTVNEIADVVTSKMTKDGFLK